MDESDCGAVGTATVQQGSDDANNVELCEQCQESELSVVASTFCSDCNDFLCDDCADQHRKLRVSKNHNLLEGNVVPKVKPRVTGEHDCSEHPGETIKLYCQSDRMLGCLLCIAESHRTCSDVTSISKLSKDIGMSKELKDFKLSVEKQNAELVSCKQILDEYRVLNDKWCDQSVKEFETFKAKIETLLDAMGKEVYSQAEEVKEKNNNEMKAITELLESIEQELESLKHGIEWREITKQTERLFIEVKRGTNQIEENVKKLDRIKDDMHIQRYKFKVNQKLHHMVEELANTVSSPLQVMSGDLECTAEVNIKSPEDRKDSGVWGLAEISAGEMMVADAVNNCLKLVHVDSKTIVQRRPLLSPPYDVAFIPDDAKVAVLLPEEHEVKYFSADKQINPCGSISVDDGCTSLQYSKGTLVVLFHNPGKIQILDLGGSILRSFTTDTAGNELFDGPIYLCLSQDLADIYVSDYRTTLISLSAANGHVSWKYTNKYVRNVDHEDSNRRDNLDCEDENTPGKTDEAQPNEEYEVIPGDEDEDGDKCFDPAGIASGDDGCLYVCSQDTNCIHVISAAGIELRVIPVDKFKLFSPNCVCYNKDRDALYVSSLSDDPGHCNFIRRLSFTNSK